MRLGINHIYKEESLPAFFAAHQQTMTVDIITSGFKVTTRSQPTLLAKFVSDSARDSRLACTSHDPG